MQISIMINSKTAQWPPYRRNLWVVIQKISSLKFNMWGAIASITEIHLEVIRKGCLWVANRTVSPQTITQTNKSCHLFAELHAYDEDPDEGKMHAES